MSHGLTLTAADTVIWAGPTTSLETFEQANARVRRIGQAHKQQVIMFQSSPVEKKMYARLRAKQQVQENILELFAEATEEG
jgi:SNF2 family DNA or RNA helicase